jgi:dUTPase
METNDGTPTINLVTTIPDTSILPPVTTLSPPLSSSQFTKQEEFWIHDNHPHVDRQSWRIDGSDWHQRSDGRWINMVHSSPSCSTHRVLDVVRQTFPLVTSAPLTPSSVPRIHAVTHQTPFVIQSDSGANTSATDNMALLDNIVWINPISINSAEKDGTPMSMTAVGRITLQSIDGTTLRPICYYSKDIDGTIISPDAITREFKDKYNGFVKHCNIDQDRGYLTFVGKDSINNITMALKSHNKLWFHDLDPNARRALLPAPAPSSLQINRSVKSLPHIMNRLSDAATYELWHQRLGHCGKNVMQTIHRHVKGVPKLKGNSFYKCPSCLAGKAGKHSHVHSKPASPPTPTPFIPVPKKPPSLPGQHFHADFGFVRGSSFSYQDANERTQTSIDGKNSYLLLIDRCTRYHWVYVSSSKTPPLDFLAAVLSKFKANHPHRTIRCDQGELASSKAFNTLMKDQGFEVEITGSNNSQQNGMAERPHRTFGNMMRCLLHSAGLGPEYWTYALIQSVWIKNRLPHAAIDTTPYQAMTGLQPDLSDTRIFGSKVVATLSTSTTSKKLDYDIATGTFLGFTGTTKNIWFRDDKTHKVKCGTWVTFDEAHMTVPAIQAPLAAQALQRVGYHREEEHIDAQRLSMKDATLKVEKLIPTAKLPVPSSAGSGYYIYPVLDHVVLQPKQTKIVNTGLRLIPPKHKTIEIRQNYCAVHPTLIVHQSLVDTTHDGGLQLILYNSGESELVISNDENIAIIDLRANMQPPIEVVVSKNAKLPPTSVPYVPVSLPTDAPKHAAAAKLETDLFLAIDMPYDIWTTPDPFDHHTHRTIQLSSRSPTLGMDLKMCPKRGQPVLKSCKTGQPAAKIPNWRDEIKNAYVTGINDSPVHSIDDIKLSILKAKTANDTHVKVSFATMHRQAMHPQHGIPQLYHDQLNVIGQHLFNMKYRHVELYPTTASTTDTLASTCPLIHKARKPKKHNEFSLAQLKKRLDWPDWNRSIFKQLDQYYDQNTFGTPEPLPKHANLLSLLWVYLIKTCGTKKARCVCNGSPNMRGTVTLAETYASALDQTGAKIFWSAVAIYNYIVIGADASNAFAEAPPPKAPLYVRVDENYRRWYKNKYPDRQNLPHDYVLRVQKALQGHPESPRLWATLIDGIIKRFNLQPCTHEPNLYFTNNYKGTNKKVLFLRQVDDFAIACEDSALAEQVIADINNMMTIDVKLLGIITRFNGIDIDQCREYVKIHNTTYIDQIIAKNPWLNDDTSPLSIFPLPMNPDKAHLKELEQTAPLTPEERLQAEKDYQFGYRNAVGEIIYAMITCRVDIAFAIIKLSQYSTKPAIVHFEAIRHLYRYLKATKTEGIYYWRKSPRTDLPPGIIPTLKIDNYDEALERQASLDTIAAYVDSDHAADSSHRRSVTGLHVTIAGGTILYKSRFQQTVAQSSTEAEFMAAAEAGRYVLYLRTILQQIGLEQHHATIMYEDNQGALLMAQAGQPTRRTRHIDIKYFAIQDWVTQDLLSFKRIDTSDNSSDVLTKATPRTLFYRHVNHIMGKIVPPYVTYVTQVKAPANASQINVIAINVYRTRDNSLQGGKLSGRHRIPVGMVE